MAPPPKYLRKLLIQQIDKRGLKLCHCETKVKALKFSWIKRLTSKKDSTLKTLPKYFYQIQRIFTSKFIKYSCNNLKIKLKIYYKYYYNLYG